MRPWRRSPTRTWYSPSRRLRARVGAAVPAKAVARAVRVSSRSSRQRAHVVAVARHDRRPSPRRSAAGENANSDRVEAAVAVRREVRAERELLDHGRGALQPGRDEEGRDRRHHQRREHERGTTAGLHGPDSRQPTERRFCQQNRRPVGTGFHYPPRSAPTSTTASKDPAISSFTASTWPTSVDPEPVRDGTRGRCSAPAGRAPATGLVDPRGVADRAEREAAGAHLLPDLRRQALHGGAVQDRDRHLRRDRR